MLFPLTIAIGIIVIACFTIYAFRLAIARWLGKTHRQVQIDQQEIRREYNNGFEHRD